MKIVYPIEWSDIDIYEREAKGWLSSVKVTLDSGCVYELSFFDPVRLSQDLASEISSGRSAVIEKGLIVIPTVTKENIEKAIHQALKEGYFNA